MHKNIEVVPYNTKWPEMFTQEAKRIQQALKDNCIAIHHIGSTSVPGLAAKPKIDIAAVVKELTIIIQALATIGYKYRGEFNIPMHYGFNKREEINVNLHVYQDGNADVELALLFRDYLRTHSEARDEYARLKQNLIADESSHKKINSILPEYTLRKNDFIMQILQKTGFNKFRFMHCTHYAEWDAYHRIFNLRPDANHQFVATENNYYFVLYKGIQIVAASHVEFLNNQEAVIKDLATDAMYNNSDYATQMRDFIAKWVHSHKRRMI